MSQCWLLEHPSQVLAFQTPHFVCSILFVNCHEKGSTMVDGLHFFEEFKN